MQSEIARVNESGGAALGAWLTMLSVASFLLVAAASTTDEQLLLGTSINLPIVGMGLPIFAFFIAAPFLFLVLHLHFLLHLRVLATRVNELITAWTAGGRERPLLNELAPSMVSFALVAKFGGVENQPMFRRMLIALLNTTGVFLPLLLMLTFQVSFLAYHDYAATWWHRVALIVDLVVLWLLWPRRAWTFLSLAGAALAIFASIFVISIPDEWGREPSWFMKNVRGLLFEGDVNRISGRPSSLFSNVLVVRGASPLLASAKKIELRGRDLRGAVFLTVDLTDARFNGAQLERAKFIDSNLTYAKFECEDRIIPVRRRAIQENWADEAKAPSLRDCVNLRGADFSGSRMSWTDLRGVRAADAIFDNASLNFAKFQNAELAGASFMNAQLRAADMTGANLDGAHFGSARLEYVDFRRALLRGANLYWSTMYQTRFSDDSEKFWAENSTSNDWQASESADLRGANLYGIWLDEWTLCSLANLNRSPTGSAKSRLSGATLTYAEYWANPQEPPPPTPASEATTSETPQPAPPATPPRVECRNPSSTLRTLAPLDSGAPSDEESRRAYLESFGAWLKTQATAGDGDPLWKGRFDGLPTSGRAMRELTPETLPSSMGADDWNGVEANVVSLICGDPREYLQVASSDRDEDLDEHQRYIAIGIAKRLSWNADLKVPRMRLQSAMRSPTCNGTKTWDAAAHEALARAIGSGK